jgi:hypothetical protein
MKDFLIPVRAADALTSSTIEPESKLMVLSAAVAVQSALLISVGASIFPQLALAPVALPFSNLTFGASWNLNSVSADFSPAMVQVTVCLSKRSQPSAPPELS